MNLLLLFGKVNGIKGYATIVGIMYSSKMVFEIYMKIKIQYFIDKWHWELLT